MKPFKSSGILAVGADPELLLFTKKGEPMSAEGRLGGTKDNPKPMDGMPEGFFIQEDNVAAEFNIPPQSEAYKFSSALKDAIRYVEKEAARHKLKVGYVSAMHFPMDQLNTMQAMTLGCEPDFNAWKNDYNPRPEPPQTLRTAAGHVHISWEAPDLDQRLAVVKACDLFLGVPSVLATAPNERRSLYGKAGACRLKGYGVEYRPLDNFWLEHHDNRCHVFNTVVTIPKKLTRGMLDELQEWEEEITSCINNHDRDQALELVAAFNLVRFPVKVLVA